MKFSMFVLVAGPAVGPILALALMAGCSQEQAGTGPSLTEPSSVVVTPVPASPHTRPPKPPETSPRRVGRLNPAVTQATIHQTVCVAGWTAKIRPPASYTNALKRAQLPAGADPSMYEEDHLMPLSLGGSPRDPKNLWPIPWSRARLDDAWETRLHRELCAGKVSLSLAQTEISAVKRKP